MPRDYRQASQLKCSECRCPPRYHAINDNAYTPSSIGGYRRTDKPAHPFKQ